MIISDKGSFANINQIIKGKTEKKKNILPKVGINILNNNLCLMLVCLSGQLFIIK